MFFRLTVVVGVFAAMAVGADYKSTTYLALGDSIAFGLDLSKLGSPAGNFTGYPEIIAGSGVKGLQAMANLSCPGETSHSFYEADPVIAPDNQCRAYKAAFGLHTFYPGTQMEETLFALQTGRKIQTVTIDIGANDLVLLQANCQFQPACITAGLPTVLTAYANNLGVILAGLRQKAGYKGTIVLLTLYSPDYSDPLQAGSILALDVIASTVASLYGVQVADGYGAFARASALFGGKPCAAGLLNKLPDGTCDVHPSPAGQELLAKTVLKVLH